MSEILLINKKTSVTFNKFPSGEELSVIKDTMPNLKKIIFEDVTIPDFSIMENLSEYALSFINSNILDYGYPIKLNASTIYFENTRFNFEKFFFMTSMPNLIDISLLYDSVEGVNLYKPYLHLLKFFPKIERIRLLMMTDKTYYDMEHKNVLEDETFIGFNNWLLYYANIYENTEFLTYMPYYKFKSNDGLVFSFLNVDIDKRSTFKRFWINPVYMDYYNTLKYHDLKKVREVLVKLSKYGPKFREKLGISEKWYDFSKNPIYSWDNLAQVLTNNLRMSRLGSHTKVEHGEPDYSRFYGLFGFRLYDTHGHYIIVNSRGSVISDYYKDEKSKKLVNELLPF